MKSKNFFFLPNSHDRISTSVTKDTEKQKYFSYSVFHTYTRINTLVTKGEFLGTQDLFFAHFTTFASAFSPLFFLIV